MTDQVSNGQPTLSLTLAIDYNGRYYSSQQPGGAFGSYLGEIRLFAGNFSTPIANGAQRPYSTSDTLADLYGFTYGGTVQGGTPATYALPDLVGTVMVGTGQGSGLGTTYILGQGFGETGNTVYGNYLPPALGGTSQGVDAHQPSRGISYYINVVGTYPTSGGMDLSAMGLVTASGSSVAPPGTMACDGRLLSVSQYTALFALLGNTYGGSQAAGTFALPDLRGRDIVGAGTLGGTTYTLGQKVGSETYSIQNNNLPASGAQPVADRQPGLVLNYLICTSTGLFPLRDEGASTDSQEEPYLGEIVASASNVVPNGWALCDGRTLSLTQYTPLFALLGTLYGGDGQTTFGLPNLQGRAVVGDGTDANNNSNKVALTTTTGSTTQTLTSSEVATAATSATSFTGTANTSNGSDDTFTITFNHPVADPSDLSSDFSTVTSGSVTLGPAATAFQAIGTAAAFTINGLPAYTSYSYRLPSVMGVGTLALTFTPKANVVDAGGNKPYAITSLTVNVNNPVTPPTITGTPTYRSTLAEAPFTPFAGLTITDASGGFDTLTITFGNGVLSGQTGSLTQTATAADLTSYIHSLPFTPAAPSGPDAVTTTLFTVSVTNESNQTTTGTYTVTDTAAPAVPAAPTLVHDTGTAGDGLTKDPTIAYPVPASNDTLLYSTDGTNFSAAAPIFKTDGTQDGVKTVYVEAKNAAGATSAASAPLTFTLDTTAPSITSIATVNAATNRGGGEQFLVTFSSPVGGVDASHFTAVTTGTVSSFPVFSTIPDVDSAGPAIGGQTSYSRYYVNLFSSGTGTLGLAFTPTTSSGSVVDAAGNMASGTVGSSASYTLVPPLGLINPPTQSRKTLAEAPTHPFAGAIVTDALGDPTDQVKISFDSGGGMLGGIHAGQTLTLTGTPASLTSQLAALTFTPPAASGPDATSTATFTYALNDPSAPNLVNLSNTISVTDYAAPAVPLAPTLVNDNGSSATDGVTSDPTLRYPTLANGDTLLYSTDGMTYSATAPTFTTDGVKTVFIEAKNAAGAISAASAPLTFTLDSGPPRPSAPVLSAAQDTGTSSSDGITKINTPTLTGTAVAGASVTIYRDDAVLVGSGMADGNGHYAITTSALPDGQHLLYATATDSYGIGQSGVSGVTYVTVETSIQPPSAPVLADAVTRGFVTTKTPTLTGTAPPLSQVTLYEGNTVLGTTYANSLGLYSVSPSAPLADGPHTLSVTASDAAGNVSARPPSTFFTIDTAPPAAPSTPTVATYQGDGSTNDNTPTITGTGTAGTTITLYRDEAIAIGSGVVKSNGTYSITPTEVLADGRHTLYTTATDAAGNVSVGVTGVTYVNIDTVAPVLPSAPAVAGGETVGYEVYTTNGKPSVSGTAEVGATINLYADDAVPLGSALVGADGTYAITSSVTLGDGRHLVYTTATDAAGNRLPRTAAVTYLDVQTVLPAASAPVLAAGSDTGASAVDAITAQRAPDITGTTVAGSKVTLYDSDGTSVLGTAMAAPNGTYKIACAPLTDGTHTLTVMATDRSGNVGPRSGATKITIDTTAPGAPTLSLTDDAGASVPLAGTTTDATPTFAGTAEANATVSFYRDGAVALGSTKADANGAYTFTPTAPIDDGRHLLYATATDAAGNVSGLGLTYATIATPAAAGRSSDSADSTTAVTSSSNSGGSGTSSGTSSLTTGSSDSADSATTVTSSSNSGGSGTSSGTSSLTTGSSSSANSATTVTSSSNSGGLSTSGTSSLTTGSSDSLDPATTATSSSNSGGLSTSGTSSLTTGSSDSANSATGPTTAITTGSSSAGSTSAFSAIVTPIPADNGLGLLIQALSTANPLSTGALTPSAPTPAPEPTLAATHS